MKRHFNFSSQCINLCKQLRGFALFLSCGSYNSQSTNFLLVTTTASWWLAISSLCKQQYRLKYVSSFFGLPVSEVKVCFLSTDDVTWSIRKTFETFWVFFDKLKVQACVHKNFKVDVTLWLYDLDPSAMLKWPKTWFLRIKWKSLKRMSLPPGTILYRHNNLLPLSCVVVRSLWGKRISIRLFLWQW